MMAMPGSAALGRNGGRYHDALQPAAPGAALAVALFWRNRSMISGMADAGRRRSDAIGQVVEAGVGRHSAVAGGADRPSNEADAAGDVGDAGRSTPTMLRPGR
jgi:hypothetical protein